MIKDWIINNAMIELFMIVILCMGAALLESVLLAMLALIIPIVWLVVLVYLLNQQRAHNVKAEV